MVIVILVLGIGILALTKQNSQPTAPVSNLESQSSSSTLTEQKITLIGTIKWLNPSDPEQYPYELTLDYPFYDELQSTGYPDVSKIPILSRDNVLQENIKGLVGKQVAVEGLMAWGLAESRYLEISSITDMSSWIVYTNKTYSYSIKYPTTYEVAPQTEKEISQMGVDSNICVRKKPNNACAVLIVFWENIDNLSLKDFVNKNLQLFDISGPLVSFDFNGYDSLLNKNQPGTNVFVKQGQFVYHITAFAASSDKEIGNIVATFKFIQ